MVSIPTLKTLRRMVPIPTLKPYVGPFQVGLRPLYNCPHSLSPTRTRNTYLPTEGPFLIEGDHPVFTVPVSRFFSPQRWTVRSFVDSKRNPLLCLDSTKL